MRADTFIEKLVQKVPELKGVYKEHLSDNDNVLPHVLMGDVTRFAIAATLAGNREMLSRLLKCLDNHLRTGSDELKELIVVSFVENLIGETAALEVMKPLMGSTLAAEVDRICRS